MRRERRRASPRRLAGDAGQVGGIEVLPFGFLIFVGGTLLLVNVWGVIDAKFAVTTAAREGVRAYVEADSSADARAAAIGRSRDTLIAFGRDGDRAILGEPRLSEPFGRCVRVELTVAYRVPAIDIPWIGGFGSLAAVESTASEVVDPYRSGLSGAAAC